MTTETHYPLYLFLFPHRHVSCNTLPPISLLFPHRHDSCNTLPPPYISSFFPTAMTAATHYPLYLFLFPHRHDSCNTLPPISLPFSPPSWNLQHTIPYISSCFPTVMTAASHYPLYLFLFPHRHETCNTLPPISLPFSPPPWQLQHTTPYISSPNQSSFFPSKSCSYFLVRSEPH